MALRAVGCLLVAMILAAALSPTFGASTTRAASVAVREAGERRSVFDAEGERFDIAAYRLNETLRLPEGRLERPIVSASEIMLRHGPASSAAPANRKRIAIAVLCSALLPGLGELYLYRESRETAILARVPIFLAFEGYNWYAYKDNNDKGRDLKDQYMTFADAHWSEARFLEQHPCYSVYGCNPMPPECVDMECWECYNFLCNGEIDYFPYIPRSLDVEEYYENLGKYDAFVYGWDDWDELAPTYWTDNRTYYWSLREDSNKHLSRADNHLMLLIVGRVISMIDAGWLAYRLGRVEEQRGGWSIDLEAARPLPAVSIRYRF